MKKIIVLAILFSLLTSTVYGGFGGTWTSFGPWSTGENLTDPGEDMFVKWDDSAGTMVFSSEAPAEVTLPDGGTIGGGSGKGNIKYKDLATDIIEIELAILELQQQAEDTAIINGTVIGTLQFFGDDDTADTDTVAGSIVAEATETWTDGTQSAQMELNAVNGGVLNDNQLILNPDGSISMSGTLSVGALEARVSGLEYRLTSTAPDPTSLLALDGRWVIDPNTSAALTIKNWYCSLDTDPGTELDADLYFADAGIGYTSPTLINTLNTTAGVVYITSFTDGTIPFNKKIYMQITAVDAATIQINNKGVFTYD